MSPASDSPVPDKGYLTALEGGRGVAVTVVAIYHSFSLFLDANFISWGYLGVDYFFILSGFILTRKYQAVIANRSLTFWQFAARRLARLYPMYLFAVVLMVVLNAVNISLGYGGTINWNPSRGRWDLLWQLTLLQAMGGPVLSWVAASWSVSVEWAVNILFFIGLWYWRLPSGLVIGLVIGCVTNLMAYGHLNVLWVYQPVFNAPIMRGIAGFGIGVLLCRSRRLFSPVALHHIHGLEVLLLISMAVGCYYHRHPCAIDYLFLLVFFPLLMEVSLTSKSWTSHFLSLPLWTGMGRISYSIYMLHAPMELLYNQLLHWNNTMNTLLIAPWRGVIYGIFLIGFSCLSYRYIEIPCRNRLRQITEKKI